MQLFSSLQEAKFNSAWLTIGSFDGVHIGHQEILQSLAAGAHNAGVPAIALTFFPHPIEVLRGPLESFYLNDRDEKTRLIAQQGIDALIIHPFTHETSLIQAQDFVQLLKSHLGIQKLWVGHDFTLGHDRKGNLPALQRLGKEMDFEVIEVQAVRKNGELLSSSQIRKLLASGNMEKAAGFLGRPYNLPGKVVEGLGRGRSIGIPTANLDIWPKRAVPASGVYVCQAHLGDRKWAAVTNIGVRPTFEDQLIAPVVETHFLDYDEEPFYGQEVKLDFLTRLRDEKRFDGVEALLEQIAQDKEAARHYFA